MRINTLRFLDYWVGRLLCVVLTGLYCLKKLFVRKPPLESPKKVLLIKLFGIGSVVLAIPAIRALKKKCPEADLFFLTFKGNEEVLTLTDMIPPENIFTIRKSSFHAMAADTVRVLLSLWKERLDVSVDMEFFSRFVAIFSFFTRARYRIGFFGFHAEGLKRGSFIDYQINYNHTLHTSRLFMTLLKPLGVDQEDYDPQLPLVAARPDHRRSVEELLKRENAKCPVDALVQWIIVNPNSSDLVELRKWPKEHYGALVDRLLLRHDAMGVVLIGSGAERSFTEEVLRAVSAPDKESRVVNLAGRTSLGGLLGIFHFGSVFISNDSGPAHLASLTGIPSIVLFGPETPALYSPLGPKTQCVYLGLDCQPCITIYNGKHSHCDSNICLQRVLPETVLELVESRLAGGLTGAEEPTVSGR
jgi:ADP-heptose:LPS heptosyltransferase